jgi:hypothetical protein
MGRMESYKGRLFSKKPPDVHVLISRKYGVLSNR